MSDGESNRRVHNEGNFEEFHEFYINSFSEYNDNVREISDVDRELTHLSFDSDQLHNLDMKYRCISTVADVNLVARELPAVGKDIVQSHSIASQGVVSSATTSVRLDKPKSSTALTDSAIEVTPAPTRSDSSRPIIVPPQPFYVAPSTHFTTLKAVIDVKSLIEIELNSLPGLSFEFFPSKCRWEGVFLEGSVRCKFEINVYKRLPSKGGGLVVEGNRLSGDSYAFVNIYKAVLNVFEPSDEVQTPNLLPIPDCVGDIDSDIVNDSIDNVLSMASSGVGESQVGASQIFCDIFKRSEITHLISKYSECVAALVSLMSVEFESCNQHAVCALAELSATHACRAELIGDEIFLRSLLPLCSDVNCSYNTIEMHRECARLLANITCGGEGNKSAEQLVACAGEESIRTWIHSVEMLKDERLRVHADRARMCLVECVDSVS